MCQKCAKRYIKGSKVTTNVHEFDLTDKIIWGILGAAKREGIGGVISILDSPAVAEAMAGLRCWIRELANWLNEAGNG